MEWSPDSTKIVIQVCSVVMLRRERGMSHTRTQTTQSYLVFITMHGDPNERPYQTPAHSIGSQKDFLPGPGEGVPIPSLTLHFEGVINIQGTLLRCDFEVLPHEPTLTLVFQCISTSRLYPVFYEESSVYSTRPLATSSADGG